MYTCGICLETREGISSYFDHTDGIHVCFECDKFMEQLERTLNYLGIDLELLGRVLGQYDSPEGL